MRVKHIAVGILLIVADQLSKIGISNTFALGDSKEIIPGFFNLTYVHNTGAAWSMMEGKMIFFYIVTLLALGIMFYFYFTMDKKDKITQYALVFMIAGTIGNFIDRLCFQYVRDFLDFIILGYDFPVFNIADMALCIGVFLLFVSIFVESYGGFHRCEK